MVMSTLAYANRMLLIYNLLPAFPLDGGRVLEAWISALTGAIWATRIVAVIGLLICSWLVWIALPSQDWWLILIAAVLAIYNWQALQAVGGIKLR